MSIASPVTSTTVSSGDSAARSVSGRLADYVEMIRPRIAVMTAVAVSAGFLLASPVVVVWSDLLLAVLGIVLLVASSSLLNQLLEIRTDARMLRTADRPLASGRIHRGEALFVGLLLAVTGVAVLWTFSSSLTTVAGLATLLAYVLVYTPLKSRSGLCTTIGAIPGAMPPVLGWLAAGGSIGAEAWALFALVFAWQFPHFLAIGWIYRDDYHRAGLKMLPSFADAGRRTGIVAAVYALAFIPVSLMPAYAGLTGRIYFAVAVLSSCLYLAATLRFSLCRTNHSARQLLFVSLIVLPLLLTVMVAEFLHLTAPG